MKTGLVARIERASCDQPGEEEGLVTRRLQVEPRTFENGVNDTVAAVANKSGRILSPAFEGEE